MTQYVDYEKADPGFVDDLIESQSYVWLIAKMLNSKGYNVTVRPVKIRPSVEKMREYSDCGDLEIVQRIEVKRRNIAFTHAGDYPYRTVIVDVAHTWDNANPKPYAYIILNETATSCIFVMGNTHRRWKKLRKNDSKKSRMREFYECPVELCKFMSISPENMKEQICQNQN